MRIEWSISVIIHNVTFVHAWRRLSPLDHETLTKQKNEPFLFFFFLYQTFWLTNQRLFRSNLLNHFLDSLLCDWASIIFRLCVNKIKKKKLGQIFFRLNSFCSTDSWESILQTWKCSFVTEEDAHPHRTKQDPHEDDVFCLEEWEALDNCHTEAQSLKQRS